MSHAKKITWQVAPLANHNITKQDIVTVLGGVMIACITTSTFAATGDLPLSFKGWPTPILHPKNHQRVMASYVVTPIDTDTRPSLRINLNQEK